MATDSIPQTSSSGIGRVIVLILTTAVLMAVVCAGVCWGSILWNGRPDQYSFTACPTAFFISSIFLLLTGAFLGIAGVARSKQHQLLLLYGSLLSGACLLGFQAYGIWVLLPGRFLVTNAGFRIAIVLASMHWLCSLMALMLINLAAARIAHATDREQNRMLLNVCSVYWLGLGFFWSGLLCSFALLL